MSASELEHRRLDADRLDISYQELVEERVKHDGPVSVKQIEQELKNEVRYDRFTSPEEDVQIIDSNSIERIFEELREKNRDGDLPYELGVTGNLDSTGNNDVTYLRRVEEQKVQGPREESPYFIE